MAAGMDLDSWKAFWSCAYWERVVKVLPEAKRSALFEAGKALMQEVNAQISKQGVNDRFGRVRSWQTPEVGSNSGYVAVRPLEEEVSTEGGTNDAKDITRWLERGHKVREPSGRAKRYDPRLGRSQRFVETYNANIIRGFMFYSWTKSAAVGIAERAAERCLVNWENAIDDILGDDYGWEDA